ncbi:MAG: hypothetical protein NC453_24840 [Muribaculum sp.]|nr:hypothetical protein [Muribaculum sp.]
MNLSSKFTLYDMLAMVIPGGVIVAGIIVWKDFLKGIMVCHCDYQTTIFDSDLILCTALIVASYVCGLINNWFSDGLFKGFRNYGYAVKSALMETLKLHKIINLKSLSGIDVYENTKDASSHLILMAIKTLGKIAASIPPCCKANKNSHILDLYYIAYYILWQNNLLGAIPLLEGQVSLLRNLITAIIIFATLTHCVIGLSWSYLLILLSIYIVMVQRQQKIYRIVWETYNYSKI